MAPQVRKVKSAFLWYQGEELKNVRAELGVSMGDAMTEVSKRQGRVGSSAVYDRVSCVWLFLLLLLRSSY
jgi:hypothetical protein